MKPGKILSNPGEITYIEGCSNYSWVYLTNGQAVLISYTLGWLENRLSSVGFYRIHRQYLVNVGRINREHHVRREYQQHTYGEKSYRELVLFVAISGYLLPVARRKKTAFLNLFHNGQ